MHIEIVGFRDNTAHHFGTAPSIKDIFTDPVKYLPKDPKEHWNLFISEARVVPGTTRHQGVQDFIPFDIDGADESEKDEVIDAVCDVLGVDYGDVLSMWSGNGVQLHLELKTPIDSKAYSNGYFVHNKPYYIKYCELIDLKLKEKGLKGHADSVVFKDTQLMRMPNTKNIKTKKVNGELKTIEKNAFIVNPTSEPKDFDLKKYGGADIPVARKYDGESIDLDSNFPIDTDAVMHGCEFLKDMFKNQDIQTEPLWYAMVSIASRLKDGDQKVHEHSKDHPNYSKKETDDKIKQAKESARPRTCANIQSLWGKCRACPNFGKVNSPISLRAPEFIATKATGFRVATVKDGITKFSKIKHHDLAKHFNNQYQYKTIQDEKNTFIFNGKFWELFSRQRLEGYVNKHTTDSEIKDCKEFSELVYRENLTNRNWFSETTFKKINLQNGVLDLVTMELMPHSSQYGFFYVLPYAYDPNAECPTFDKHLAEVTNGDKGCQNILLEFAGYSVSNDPPWAQKCLLATGGGNNGKSTLFDTFKKLVGEDNHSSLTMDDLVNQQNLATLESKLFNLAEETPNKIYKSDRFKNIVTGGSVTVKTVWIKPYQIKVRAKFIFACNDLPESKDTSYGFFRRFIIVPFNRVFTEKDRDVHMNEKLEAELPGILNKVLAAYKICYKNKKFSESKLVMNIEKEYMHQNDPVREWLVTYDHEFTEKENQFVSFLDMYNSYKSYCDENGEKPETSKIFSQKLCHIDQQFKPRRTTQRIGKKSCKGFSRFYMEFGNSLGASKPYWVDASSKD